MRRCGRKERPLHVGTLIYATVSLALGCVAEREAPPAESAAATDTTSSAAEPVPPAQPALQPVDTPAPSPEAIALPVPACGSFRDAVRSRVTYAAVQMSRSGPRTPGGDFSFWMADGALRGEVEAEHGGVVRRHTLQNVHHEAGSDSVFFWYESGGGVRSLYRLHGSCDGLRGTARLFVTEENTRGTVVDIVLAPAE